MTNGFNFLIYKTPDKDVKVNAVIKDDTIWLTQKSMAELFGCSSDNISLHLKNIFEAGELEKDSVTEKISATAADGKNYPTNFYNLDAIISVGYRVNSIQATHFRIWATKVLKEYIQKGFVLDDERLKQGKDAFGKDYFRELLERVRSIRASERRIYQQITDIFAECSIDYDKDSQITQDFYSSWCEQCIALKNSFSKFYPVVQIEEENDYSTYMTHLRAQVDCLLEHFEYIAFRSQDEKSAINIITDINNLIKLRQQENSDSSFLSRIIYILDYRYINDSTTGIATAKLFIEKLAQIGIFNIIISATSFPMSVSEVMSDKETKTVLPIKEISFFEKIKKESTNSKLNLIYSDYATANPSLILIIKLQESHFRKHPILGIF